MGVEPKIEIKPPKSSIFLGVFHYFQHPFWGSPIFGNTHMIKGSLACQNLYHMHPYANFFLFGHRRKQRSTIVVAPSRNNSCSRNRQQ